MSPHPPTHIRKDSAPPFLQEGLNERGELWGEGRWCCSGSQSVREGSGHWMQAAPSLSDAVAPTPPTIRPLSPTSKGLCTISHYCSVCRSLKHCHRDRGWPSLTPRLFCSATMMGKLHPATHTWAASVYVKDLDLSAHPSWRRWSSTHTNKQHIQTALYGSKSRLVQDDGKNHKRREMAMSPFMVRLFCFGFDWFSANMLYTRLEYSIPLLCEERRLQNKIIMWDWSCCVVS